MAFHRNNNGSNNRYNNNRQNFRPRHNNNQHHNNQQGGQRRHVNRINHVFESTGPDGRVRGTAQQLVEKYTSLARDAHGSGDPVLMLNYYQHAEHYQRLYAEIMDENAVFEREREAQRAQYNQQPAVEPAGGDDSGFNGQADAHQSQAGQEPPQQPQQQPQRASRPEQADQPNVDSGSMSTGGRVMGRRPSGPRADNRPQANQLQDDHMPSFLKQDIPIKTSRPAEARPTETTRLAADVKPAAAAPAPKTPKAAPNDGNSAVAADVQTDEPTTAAFGKRRAPARRTTTDKAAE